MASIVHVFRREFAGYFITPVAYVFIVLFLALAAALAFYVGYFFERGRADLQSFFQWHPWLYLFFMPAISMRLWAEERKTGTIELFLTLPVSTAAAVVGKFPGSLGVRGARAGADLPDLVDGQLSGGTGQRRRRRQLYRLLPAGRRLSRHRLLPVCAHPEPGGRLCADRDRMLHVQCAGCGESCSRSSATQSRRNFWKRSPPSACSAISTISSKA